MGHSLAGIECIDLWFSHGIAAAMDLHSHGIVAAMDLLSNDIVAAVDLFVAA
jgi:hypothetical protein